VVMFIGQVPTNTIVQTLASTNAPTNPQAGAYNLVNFNQPHRFGPDQMGLLEAGFHGAGNPRDSDHLWKFDRETQQSGKPIYYRTTDSTWRFTTGELVPTNYFSPDDAIVIQLHNSDTSLTWTNRILYPIPTRDMSP